eukprot:g8779.t1
MFSQPLIESEQMYDDTKETLTTLMMEGECSTARINKDGDLYPPEHPPYNWIYVSSNDVSPGYDDDDSFDYTFMLEGAILNNNEHAVNTNLNVTESVRGVDPINDVYKENIEIPKIPIALFATKLDFEAPAIWEMEIREVDMPGKNVMYTADEVKKEAEDHLKTPKRSKRSKMEKKTIKNTTVKFVSRKRAKKGQKNCAEKRQKRAKKEKKDGRWSKKSRQMCLKTFNKYCNLSSNERHRKIHDRLGGERTMSKFCLAISYEYYFQI